MPQSYCTADPAFISRIVGAGDLMPLVVAEAMKEVMDTLFIPDMQRQAPWLPDGTDMGTGNKHGAWIVTGLSRRSFVSWVPGLIPAQVPSENFTDKYGKRHWTFDPSADGPQSFDVGTRTVTIMVARAASNTGFLQAMERGELAGFGNKPGPPVVWDHSYGDIIENVVFRQQAQVFWQLVQERIQEKFAELLPGRGVNFRGGMIY